MVSNRNIVFICFKFDAKVTFFHLTSDKKRPLGEKKSPNGRRASAEQKLFIGRTEDFKCFLCGQERA